MKVKIEGIQNLQRRLRESGDEIKKAVKYAVAQSALDVQDDAKKACPVGIAGALRDSIIVEFIEEGLIAEISARMPYSEAVEFGTRPHFVGVDKIKRWAELRGINPYALQQSIARYGTEAHPFLFPAFEQNKTKFLRNVEELIRRLL